MKALSLWQPWASLWLSPAKVHETRPRRTSHRGWLLVHAARHIKFDLPPELRGIVDDEFGGHWGMELPRGAIIGRVFVTDCVSLTDTPPLNEDDAACGDFAPGRWGYLRSQYEAFRTPIPYRGQQMLFDVPDKLVSEAEVSKRGHP